MVRVEVFEMRDIALMEALKMNKFLPMSDRGHVYNQPPTTHYEI
jgi:hypothetical protein